MGAVKVDGLPEVPTSDTSIWFPFFAEGGEGLGLGEFAFVEGEFVALLDAVIKSGKYVGATEAEDQEHVHSPGADAADGSEACEDFVVGEFFDFLHSGDDALDGFGGEVAEGGDFLAGETGGAKVFISGGEHLRGSGEVTGADAVFYFS